MLLEGELRGTAGEVDERVIVMVGVVVEDR